MGKLSPLSVTGAACRRKTPTLGSSGTSLGPLPAPPLPPSHTDTSTGTARGVQRLREARGAVDVGVPGVFSFGNWRKQPASARRRPSPARPPPPFVDSQLRARRARAAAEHDLLLRPRSQLRPRKPGLRPRPPAPHGAAAPAPPPCCPPRGQPSLSAVLHCGSASPTPSRGAGDCCPEPPAARGLRHPPPHFAAAAL
ncbi:uncharacterized protein LOC129563858 [Moschus berezovskii]|uniref:uncharacterized protein LOC129563858 n=1 Tax=Moschus berezovskii TaxID=68408 RepID=UPI00244404BB|nr:uncharacterized protein LOC129563858 [Moschus berezovskii]